MGEGGRDEKVASSKRKSKLKTKLQKSIPYLWPKWRQNGWKTIPFGTARTYVAHIREYPPRDVTILLSLSAPLTDCCFSDATTAARIHEKLISLKPWSQQNPIPFLNIQASSKTVWFEMLKANHRTQTALTSLVSPSRNRTIAFSVVLCFFASGRSSP